MELRLPKSGGHKEVLGARTLCPGAKFDLDAFRLGPGSALDLLHSPRRSAAAAFESEDLLAAAGLGVICPATGRRRCEGLVNTCAQERNP